MKVLVVGSGGREHALCYRLSQSSAITEVFCAPGNAGTSMCATNVPVAADKVDGLVQVASDLGVDLTIVGPEGPICAGIRERFVAAGLRVLAPSAAAAQLEGSKAFAKQLMLRHGVRTAPFAVVEDFAAGAKYIDTHPRALVIKADGLAAGKGVYVCHDGQEAKDALRSLLDGSLGTFGRRVVIEERLVGEEGSFIVITDGERIVPLATSQDHKAALDGDRGPNTGGMGAYSPAPLFDETRTKFVLDEVIKKTIHGLESEGISYRGFLYAGVMVTDDGIYVLEFNCRLGDPETQPLMARCGDDLVPFLDAVADRAMPTGAPTWDPRPALCVVMAAPGYPGTYRAQDPIRGLSSASALDDVFVFHAGTAVAGTDVVTAGGRVLGVTALGADLAAARTRAYAAVDCISWPGAHFRRDIGLRGIPRATCFATGPQ